MTSILSKWNKTGGITALNMTPAQLTLISPRNSLSMLWVLYLSDYRKFYEGMDKKIHWIHVHWHGVRENADRPVPRVLHEAVPHIPLLWTELCSYLDQGLVSLVWMVSLTGQWSCFSSLRIWIPLIIAISFQTLKSFATLCTASTTKYKGQSTSDASRYQRNVKWNSCYSLVSYHQGKQYLNYRALF